MTFVVCDDEEIQRKKITGMILSVYPDAKITECERADEVTAMEQPMYSRIRYCRELRGRIKGTGIRVPAVFYLLAT